MNYRQLTNTDLTVSSLCLGTSNFGATIPQADAFTLMDAFVDLGGNFLDTAHVYANWIPTLPRSSSEKTIGAWMKARGNRNRMFVGTKGAHPQLQAGKIRAFGCSNWSTARMQAALDYANAHGCHGFVANQPMWSLAQPNAAAFGMPGLAAMDEAMFAFHLQSGWAVIPYTSQARGFFNKVAGQGVTGLSERDRQAYWNVENAQRSTIIQGLSTAYGATSAQIALAYLLCQPVTTIPVIGCRTVEQLQDSVHAAELHLQPAEIALLQTPTDG